MPSNGTVDIPDCMIALGGDRYRCENTGWVVTTTVFPIRCACRKSQQPPPPTLTERLDDRYETLEDPSFLRPREQVDDLLAKCKTNKCGRFDSACGLCKRIAAGCSGMEHWLVFLTAVQKWCSYWGDRP